MSQSSIVFRLSKSSPLYRKVSAISKKTGLSISRIVYYSLQVGFPEVVENVQGLYLDFEARASVKEKYLRDGISLSPKRLK